MMDHESIKSYTAQLWANFCNEVEERFVTDHRAPDIDILISDNLPTDYQHLWSTRVKDDSITISSGVDLKSPFFNAIIAREVLATSFPLCVSRFPRCYDLACHFGKQHLNDESLTQLWDELWSRESPPTSIPGGHIYNPIMQLEDLDRLDIHKGFNELMTRLYRIDRYKTKMSFEEFSRYLRVFIDEYTVRLTATEIRVVELLLREPNLTRANIAKRLDKSTTWVSTVIPNLLNRGILVHYERVSLSSVGVRTFDLILTAANQEQCYDVIKLYPFLYSCSPIIVGDTGFIATVSIPHNPANLNSLVELEKTCARLGITMRSFELIEKGVSSFLSSYDTKKGEWNIDWNALQLEAQQLASNEALLNAYPPPFQKRERTIEIDDLGARILAAFEMGHKTVRKLRDAVRARQKRVVELFNQFKQNGIIMDIWEVHHIGLNELVIVASEDPLTSKIVAALSARLPKSYLHFNGDTLFMRTFLPKGGAIGFAKVLNRLPTIPQILLTEKPTYGQWSLAKMINLWNTRNQSWRPSIDALSEWYEYLGEL